MYFLTPEPGRNKDSQTQTLLDQGFKKVALPEVRLFNPSSTANFCTLYQKDCAAGDTIALGKWAVPVFFALDFVMTALDVGLARQRASV